MNNINDDKQFDPLGLFRLGDAVEKLPSDSDATDSVKEAYAAVAGRYTALQDRYRLLKAANRQLFEEVAWLRDQCDDFALEAEAFDEAFDEALLDPVQNGEVDR